MISIQPDKTCDVESIEHQGIINELNENSYFVSIISQSACASCSVKGACNVSEMKEEVVEVPRKNEKHFKVGDQVVLSMQKSLGTKAVMLGYIFPFLLMVGTLIISVNLVGNEGIAGLLGLGILMPYYFVLYLLKKQLKQTFVFKIRS